MRERIFILLLGAFVFLFFVLFSYLVHKDVFTQFDFDTTVRIQDNIQRSFDTPFSILSLIGSAEISSLILLVILILFRRLKGLVALPFYFSVFVIELFGKVFVTHPGPPFMFFRYGIDFLFPSSYVQPGFSYPSGHAARTAFISIIAMILFFRVKKLSRTHKLIMISLIILFDLLMFASRIYLGEHWATDVIGGALLGASLGLLSLVFL